jgi:hypothetical protein
MFQSSPKRLRAWLDLVDDMLVGDEEPVDARLEVPPWEAHPHRRPLRWQRARRPGSVPPAPAHCLCPVQPVRSGAGERPSRRDSEHALTN